MIVFDLICKNASHVFEIWFGSTADYEEQKARGLVVCPYCGSADVDKAVMAPNVAAKGNRGGEIVPASPAAAAGATNMPPPQEFKAMVAKLAEVQAKMLEGSEYVGSKFADEARSMYHGEREARTIHGQTTAAEAQALIEEGVPVAPLPLPLRPPESSN